MKIIKNCSILLLSCLLLMTTSTLAKALEDKEIKKAQWTKAIEHSINNKYINITREEIVSFENEGYSLTDILNVSSIAKVNNKDTKKLLKLKKDGMTLEEIDSYLREQDKIEYAISGKEAIRLLKSGYSRMDLMKMQNIAVNEKIDYKNIEKAKKVKSWSQIFEEVHTEKLVMGLGTIEIAENDEVIESSSTVEDEFEWYLIPKEEAFKLFEQGVTVIEFMKLEDEISKKIENNYNEEILTEE